jgi:MoaA/NifB/PqqE/SkfB family radical SAM enzyme
VSATSPMVHGPLQSLMRVRLWLRVAWLALHRGGLRESVRTYRALVRQRSPYAGNRVARKYARVGGRCFWDLYCPGWPSPAFDRLMTSELRRLRAPRAGGPLQTMMFAITKSCPLRCQHCCEWDVLNRRETLPVSALHTVVRRFQERGIPQIFFSGGEPLQRFRELVEVLEAARVGTDFWILSSGWGLTPERAAALRKAGLTGVSLSLDHWDEAAHDRFRGRPGSFTWIVRAAQAAREAGLVVAVSICPTREFVRAANLEAYADTARRLGASFIQILEPQAVGRFAGQDVALTLDQVRALEAFALALNFDPAFRDHPSVAYIAMAKRHGTCHGAGDRYLYVDTDAQVHPCPFCRVPAGSAALDDLDAVLETLCQGGCPQPAYQPEGL